jgi:DNA mismatch repair protein MutS2
LARRITTLVATHYSELKAFAHMTAGVENASAEFDLETLSPTYKLQIGLPGRSNAFAIAQRLGLAPEIVHAAQTLVSPEELQTDALLAEIQQAQQQAIAAQDAAVLTERRMSEQEHQLAARLAAIEAERSAILGEARAQARRELAEVRRELQALQRELGDAQQQSSLGERWLAEARARLEDQEEAIVPPPSPPASGEQRLPGEISVGDTVWVAGLGTTGRVSELDGDGAEVQVGNFGVRVQRDSLERRAHREPIEPEPAAVAVSFHPSPGVELDLRGQRVDEVLPRLDKYLDDAFLAGLPSVRIIHGKGTGTLRQAVRQRLRNHALVNSQRPGEQGEGGQGVTIAYLMEG